MDSPILDALCAQAILIFVLFMGAI